MPWFRVAFLLFVLSVSSGYRFRCYAFCNDQTAIQNDYVEQRDRCREYAELKLDMSLRGMRGPIEGKSKKTQLVTLFNDCMANNGWNIAPDVKAPPAVAGTTATPPPSAASSLSQGTPAEVEDTYQQKASLSRSAECMFARHAAANSTISAARAKACDLECSQRLSASPDAPRPAACPTDVNPNNEEMIRGGEREL